MNKGIVKKYTVVGETGGYETRIYYYLQSMRVNNYHPVIVANTNSVKKLPIVFDKHIGIDAGKLFYEGYVYLMGSVYEGIEYGYNNLIIIQDEIKKVFYG